MRIGFVGLGALGKAVALAINWRDHEVMGFDVRPERMQKTHPFQERGPKGRNNFDTILRNSTLQFGSLSDILHFADLIFVAVQTPHQPQFEGVTPLTAERADFDYSFLKVAAQSVVDAAQETHRRPPLAIISTVLPGTIRREILPITEGILPVVYAPSFISMGNVMQDFLNPEFILIGVHDLVAARILQGFYRSMVSAPLLVTTIENAEFIKIGYNVAIGVKVMLANMMGELAHRLGNVDIDVFTHALSLSHRRILSTKYLTAGTGDGGPCHGRDAFALSWLAREVGLSFNLFDAIMQAREKHAEFLCDLMCAYDLPKVILGTAFKAGSNIETGSAAILCKNILIHIGYNVYIYDPIVSEHAYVYAEPFLREPMAIDYKLLFAKSYVYLIGCNHPEFVDYQFPQGSVVIDPWGYIPDQEGVEVIQVGRN